MVHLYGSPVVPEIHWPGDVHAYHALVFLRGVGTLWCRLMEVLVPFSDVIAFKICWAEERPLFIPPAGWHLFSANTHLHSCPLLLCSLAGCPFPISSSFIEKLDLQRRNLLKSAKSESSWQCVVTFVSRSDTRRPILSGPSLPLLSSQPFSSVIFNNTGVLY